MRNTLKVPSLKTFAHRDLLSVLLIVIVTFAGFGLGRLSINAERTGGISIYYGESDLSNSVVVASRNGTKYHYLWCGGATRIKDENKLFFSGVDSAKKAGFEKAKNCKGLK